MMEYVRMVVAMFVTFMGFWMAADIVFGEESKKNLASIIIVILGSMIISIFNLGKLVTVLNYTKILLIFLMMAIFYRNKYNIGTSDSLVGSAIVYGNLVLAEVLITIFLSLLDYFLIKNVTLIVRYSIFSGLITALLSILVLRIIVKKHPGIFKKIRNNDSKLVITIFSIFLIVIIILGIIPLKNIKLGVELFLLLLVIVGFLIVAMYILKEKIEKDNRLKEYEQLSEYAKANESLLEDYRVRCHESSNHLIIIDNMISKNNKKAHEYIRSLLSEHKVNKYYFINELKHIPITEFKGFINFKLMTMINENMDLQINVSPEIKNSKLKELSQKDRIDLYNITGVLLDNACDASKESKEGQVVFTMYKEREDIVMMIANTYKGEIDVNRVSEYGYSTKGKNHGTGLYIVDKVISKNPKFTKETSIIENYFIQMIRIK